MVVAVDAFEWALDAFCPVVSPIEMSGDARRAFLNARAHAVRTRRAHLAGGRLGEW